MTKTAEPKPPIAPDVAEPSAEAGASAAAVTSTSPAQATARVDHVGTRDGVSLLIRHWPVTRSDPWAAMVLIHGLAEHCGRYEHVGAQLARAGVDTHAFDLRGFGGSGGRRAWVDRWSQLHDDLEERLVAVRSIAPARPLVLYGHSMGGLIVLGYVLDGRALPDLLVLSAPAIGADVPLWQRLVAGPLRRLAPNLLIANGIDANVLSSDPAISVAYAEDPLNQHRTTVRFGHALFGEQRRVGRSLDRLAIPALVIHGGDDELVPAAASLAFDGRPGVTRCVYPGLRHELHNEAQGPRVIDDVLRWLRDRVSRIHSPATS
jgi:alpha-beta hydrolase superfamily lysophospholipase